MMDQKKQTQRTPNQRIWERLKRNKPALWGLGWIGLSILMAIFGYWLTPDSTPFANDQVSEIRDKGVAFSIKMLKLVTKLMK